MPNSALPILSDPTYRIESELGSGGGGVVYKAWHTRLNKHVVIKELKSASALDVETQRNEVEALKNVKSPYLPQVFDFLTEGNRIYTVMEFIEGESLDHLLARGQQFTQPQVVKWYGQLASALEVIHRRDIFHRDIKPANIMLMPNGNVCLIDFNAALVSGNVVRLVSRSLGYASPEQYEIYEQFKKSRSSPIDFDDSSANGKQSDSIETELDSDFVTTRLDFTHVETQLESVNKETASPLPAVQVDWKRSDVYSLGATMYHLLSGKRPPQRATDVVAISKLGHFSEGIVSIIEGSMALNPAERFASATFLSEAVRNIHKHDSRWRLSQSKKIAAAVILPLAFGLFAVTALFGHQVMRQEKEERYYEMVHRIEHEADPLAAYASALEIFWNRIDPYRAMAERLWAEGNIEDCMTYIEENLGNIAEFQAIPSAATDFGDIYYILGNCYYLQSSDYHMACGNFEIAVQFVKDNPIYYRDYAISLARIGNVTKAERELEKAQVLHLDTGSLRLLQGEIAFAKKAYSEAADHFEVVIRATDDDYLRYRAYHACDEVYKLLDHPEQSVQLLEGALNRIPLNRVPEMTERLADAYVKSGDYEQAITTFEKLAQNDMPQFHILQNLAILLQNADRFEDSATVLERMADLFPLDYRVPMHQAYLEAERQAKIVNEYRDYALTKEYYDNALQLYTENLKPGESDPEMQQLELMIEQLRINRWID